MPFGTNTKKGMVFNMKKVIFFLAAVTIIICMVGAQIVNADDRSSDFTFDDAVKLTKDACAFWDELQFFPAMYCRWEERISVSDDPTVPTYYPLREENGYTDVSGCINAAGKFFVRTIAEKCVTVCVTCKSHHPVFYVKDNVTYKALCGKQASLDYKLFRDFRNFRIDGDRAVMEVTVPTPAAGNLFLDPETDQPVYYDGINRFFTAEISFIKTEAGWRIDECPLVSALEHEIPFDTYYKDHPAQAPATGDETAARAAVFAAGAVLAAVVPALILTVKRRRKEK